ncbi:alternate-type signal peptide domain-containing protein [Cryobacterium sp. M15]|jgi:alternate signal-mediated exported protein|uniref:alternate-type signal peptide domain-containing protein n=1 Tax=Cryobacterium sp. M15 TaxID=2048291 RepID=UPI000CE32538|nr:alternate-type signal peptide domain-containing protein [Cryobacterium sp. M15]
MLTGSIAGAAGVALLLGGAGTFALWNDDAAIAGATINAGTLTVEALDTIWRDNAGAEITDLNGYFIVPGDTLTYTTKLIVNAKGDNLQATLNIPENPIATPVGDADEDGALSTALAVTTALSTVVDGVTVESNSEDGSFGITASEEDQEYFVTVAVNFPSGAPGYDNNAQAGSVDLSEFDVTVTQTP